MFSDLQTKVEEYNFLYQNNKKYARNENFRNIELAKLKKWDTMYKWSQYAHPASKEMISNSEYDFEYVVFLIKTIYLENCKFNLNQLANRASACMYIKYTLDDQTFAQCVIPLMKTEHRGMSKCKYANALWNQALHKH